MVCIVFDLDNTLVHATKDAFGDADAHPVCDCKLWIHVRPHVRELLLHTKGIAKIGIWTAGTREYAHEVTVYLASICGVDDVFEFVLSRENATFYQNMYVKDLDVVRGLMGIDDVYLVDDSAVHLWAPQNHGRVIQVPPFHYTDDASADCALLYLMIQMEVMVRMHNPHSPVPLRPVFSTA